MKVCVLIPALTLAIAVSSAFAWPGRPSNRPPKPPNPGAPPPAWIETQASSAWLAYGSYCWKTACVDMIAPNTRPDLPTIAVKRGSLLRVHVGFPAKSITVSIGTKPIRAILDSAKRTASWKTIRGGILMVSARATGDASYVARLRVS